MAEDVDGGTSRRLDASSLMLAQWENENGGENAQPRGHTAKLVSMLVLAILRHLLWTCAQIPLPASALEREVIMQAGAENDGEDVQNILPSYAVWSGPPPPASQNPYLPMPSLRHAVQLLHSCARLEASISAMLTAMQAAPPHVLHIAMVSGQSLAFPRHVLVLCLDHMLAFGCDGVPDSDMCEARRRKTSALLERKFVRFCMEHDVLLPDVVPPTRTRIMIQTPANLHVPGWHHRPHWRAPLPSPAQEPADAAGTVPPNAHPDASSTHSLPPARVSRMSGATHTLLSQHSARKIACQRRSRSNAPCVHVCIEGRLPTVHRTPQLVTWQECDVQVSGFREA